MRWKIIDLRGCHYGAVRFVVMMLNLGGSEIEEHARWLKPQVWISPQFLSAIMLVAIVYAILGVPRSRASAIRQSVR